MTFPHFKISDVQGYVLELIGILRIDWKATIFAHLIHVRMRQCRRFAKYQMTMFLKACISDRWKSDQIKGGLEMKVQGHVHRSEPRRYFKLRMSFTDQLDQKTRSNMLLNENAYKIRSSKSRHGQRCMLTRGRLAASNTMIQRREKDKVLEKESREKPT